MLTLISDLVSFKTVYSNYNEFDKCISYIKNYFADTKLYIKEYEFNKNKSLVISNADTNAFDIIFCGHIDVVPADDALFSMKNDEGKLLGRGVSDMKGQVAVMMKLMKELNTNKKVALFITSDEERGGFDGSGRLLNELSYTSEFAVVPDGGYNFELVLEEKGVLQLKISVTGSESHSSELWKGENAIAELFKVYNKLIQKYPIPKNEEEWFTSINLARIEGGDALNKVPKQASMYLDIRHVHEDKKDDILSYIQSINNKITIEVLAKGEEFFVDAENETLKKFKRTCEHVLQTSIKEVKFQGASDARFFAAKGIPVALMNPIGGNAHCVDEWMDLDSLEKYYEICKRFLSE